MKTQQGLMELGRLMTGQGGDPFTIVAIGSGDGDCQDGLASKIAQSKASIEMIGNIVVWNATFTPDKEIIIQEYGVFNSKGVMLLREVVSKRVLQKGDAYVLSIERTNE